jgi:hypothetical protein
MLIGKRSIEGQGPGEISKVSDIKFFKDKIYFIDAGSNLIKIFNQNGKHHKDIRIIGTNLLFRKISFIGDNLLLGVFGVDDMFSECTMNGVLIRKFGEYIDKNYQRNMIYHQYRLSQPFESTKFYYLPLFLGFVGLYDKGELVFAKETIDGEKKPRVLVERTNHSVTKRMKGVPFRTVSKSALNKDFILIKAIDMEKKIAYWDIYSINDFDYLFSIKNPPKSYDFDISGNILVSVSESDLKIFSIKKLKQLVKKTKDGSASPRLHRP